MNPLHSFRAAGIAQLNKLNGLKPSPFEGWTAALLAMTALGVLVIVGAFVQGHEKVYNTSRWMPWGILISTYVFFVVSSTGMCLISSLGHVFRVERYEPLGRRAIFLAIITLVAGFIVIAAEIERPWRMFIWAVLTPNPSSAIWWMGTLYILYLIFLIIEFLFLSGAEMVRRARAFPGPGAKSHNLSMPGSLDASEERLRKYMKFAWLAGAGGVVSAVAAHSTLGAVFGFVKAAPLWYGPYMPIYFILSALVSGAALLALVIILTYKLGGKGTSAVHELILDLGKLLLLFLGIFLFFTVWKMVSGVYGYLPGKLEATEFLLKGPLALGFWGFEIFLGLLVPLVILLNPKTRTVSGVGIASLLVMIGIFAARYNFVVAGQLTSVAREVYSVNFAPGSAEVSIVIGAFGLCTFFYIMGQKLLPLGEHTESDQAVP